MVADNTYIDVAAEAGRIVLRNRLLGEKLDQNGRVL